MVKDIAELRKNLSDRERAVLRAELEKHRKSKTLAYVLWLVVGMLGIHKFYVGKVGMGILYLVLGAVGLGSVVSGLVSALEQMTASQPGNFEAFTGIMVLAVIGSICLLVLCVLLTIDLFTIPREIRKRNERIELAMIERIMGGADGADQTERDAISARFSILPTNDT